MRTILYFLFILCILSGCRKTEQISFNPTADDTKKIATFCKIWGFLKYYHPAVAKGKTDWDQEFLHRIRSVILLNSKQETSDYYIAWINSLGRIKNCISCNSFIPDSLKKNFDLNWLNDTALFTEPLIEKLKYIEENRNQEENYYVQQLPAGNMIFINEEAYHDSIYPEMEMRLLGLARYWNIIEYFFPYKYLTDEAWSSVLAEMIPVFLNTPDTIAYHLAMLELTVKINDSHGVFVTPYTNHYFGLKWAPFQFSIIDNKAIVTGYYNDSLCSLNNIEIGDVFLSVNGKSITDILKEKSKYIAASNESAKLRDFLYAVFNGETDSVITLFERNGMPGEKYIKRYLFKEFNFDRTARRKDPVYKILETNIGYVNMGILVADEVDSVMEKLNNTTGIIFDLRNYPHMTLYKIMNHLNATQQQFFRFTNPDYTYPGIFKSLSGVKYGSENEDPYKGKVVILFNETTQSHAEFTVMALQTASQVITIGSQTAGADGNVSEIVFPGNYKTMMSGIGIYYPDGKETQRVGILPDIEVKPTIAGILEGRDEILEKAIEVLSVADQ